MERLLRVVFGSSHAEDALLGELKWYFLHTRHRRAESGELAQDKTSLQSRSEKKGGGGGGRKRGCRSEGWERQLTARTH